jgi:Tfp pilus assembly protein PilF
MRDDGNGSAAIMHHPAGDVPTEDARLDDAIRRADELLVSSLKSEEQRRSRQRRTFTLTLIGGLIMIAAVCVILGVLLQAGGGGGAQAASNVSPEQLTQEGWQLWQQRKLTEAEAKFEQALKADPKQTAAWNGLGWAQLNQGKNDKAEKAFQEVVKLEPEHPAALNGLGWINYNRKKFDAAEKYFLQAAANNASASYSGLAQIYLLQGKYDQALPWALLLTQQQGADVAMAGKLVEAAKTKKLDAGLKKQIEPAEAGSAKS